MIWGYPYFWKHPYGFFGKSQVEKAKSPGFWIRWLASWRIAWEMLEFRRAKEGLGGGPDAGFIGTVAAIFKDWSGMNCYSRYIRKDNLGIISDVLVDSFSHFIQVSGGERNCCAGDVQQVEPNPSIDVPDKVMLPGNIADAHHNCIFCTTTKKNWDHYIGCILFAWSTR